jgi:hypothetical protein
MILSRAGRASASPLALTRGWRDLATTALATALLAIFWGSAVMASREKSQTSDELVHLGAGYTYNRFSDFRLHPENGILPQRVIGLAPLASGARFPLDEERWRNCNTWDLCWDFFYAANNPSDWILLCARSLNALFGVALGLLIFGLARAWHGRAGGLIALGFFAFSPNFLAHSALATSDLAAAFTLTLAPWLFWRHLQRRDLASGAYAGLASGLALAAKHNGVLLGPMYLLLVLLDAWLPAVPPTTASPRLRRTAANFGLAVGQAVVGVIVLWAFYQFRLSPRGPDMPEFAQFDWAWPNLLDFLGAKRHLFEVALYLRLLPEAWLYGLGSVLAGAGGRPAFFAGEHAVHGWWYFFPGLFLVKTTLGLVVAFGVGLALAGTRLLHADSFSRRRWVGRYAPLAVSAFVVGTTAMLSRLNIGDRHILAVYPVLLIALGSLGRRRWTALAAAALLACHVQASLAIRPHYLASFNLLAGGPIRAHRLVADSALDWGQDLPALRDWLQQHRHPGEPFYLGYFGSAWPPHYGVRPSAFLTSATSIVRPPVVPHEWQPGVYALSATILVETYSRDRGPWTTQQEENYRSLRARFNPQTSPPQGGIDEATYARYDELRLARLCKFLQRRTPDDHAGYSILIFRLGQADLREILDGPVIATHRLKAP